GVGSAGGAAPPARDARRCSAGPKTFHNPRIEIVGPLGSPDGAARPVADGSATVVTQPPQMRDDDVTRSGTVHQRVAPGTAPAGRRPTLRMAGTDAIDARRFAAGRYHVRPGIPERFSRRAGPRQEGEGAATSAGRRHEMSSVPTQARVVIIGAGIVGNSMAWHLANLGWRDIVLLENGTLPNPGGSTGHASNFIFL